jgi:hypothetical protein
MANNNFPRVLIPGALLIVASCGDILGLGDFKNDCGGDLDVLCTPDGAGGASGLCQPGTSAPCYDGPDGTLGRGICKGGTKTCGSDGLYGDCVGQTLPKSEDACDNVFDDDCDGHVNNGCPCMPGQTVACYDGSDATRNVGACHDGMHSCNPDGDGFGPCGGQQLPAAEDYSKLGDENCDGVPSADSAWVDTFNCADQMSGVFATGVAPDGVSDVLFAVGNVVGTCTVGTDLVTSPSTDGGDMFVTKIDGSGAPAWVKSYTGGTQATDIVFDSVTDHAILTGNLFGSIDLGAGALSSGPFVLALKEDGTSAWSYGCSIGNGYLTPAAVGVDAHGNVTFAGTFAGTMACGTTMLSSPDASTFSVYVVQVDSMGVLSSATSWGDVSPTGQQSEWINGLAVASDGSVWLSGLLKGKALFGSSGSVVANPEGSLFLAKLSTSGQVLFGKLFGGGSSVSSSPAGSLAVDAHGDVYFGSTNQGTIDFGGGPITATGTWDAVVAAFDENEFLLWASDFGATGGYNGTTGLAIEPNGDVIVSGSTSHGINLGAGLFLSDQSDYTFLARFQASATPGAAPALLWSKFYGGDKSNVLADTLTRGMTLVPRPGSNLRDVVLGGSFATATDFGTGQEPQIGSASGFVVRVAP